MPERNYYVICEDNCKFPAMTKEQTLAAIKQAIETGEIKDIDTGFVTKIVEQNSGAALSFWVGTSAEYNALESKIHNCFYIITDDTKAETLEDELAELKRLIEEEKNSIPPLAEIKVTAYGSVACTDATGKKISGKQNGNTWTFNAPGYGVYTIKGTHGTMTKTKQVNVTAVQQYNESIEYYDDNFANNTIKKIIEVIQAGVAPASWKVGDKNGNLRIIGKNHDTYTDGRKAPFTFAYEESVTSTVINQTATSEGGWASCYARNTALKSDTVKEKLGALYTAAKPVIKLTSMGGLSSTIGTTQDSIFFLSEVELFGTTNNTFAGEGVQYEFYKNGNYKSITPQAFWLRSPYKSNIEFWAAAYQRVDSSYHGVASGNGKITSIDNCMVCFCI